MRSLLIALPLSALLVGCQGLGQQPPEIEEQPQQAARYYSQGLAWSTGRGEGLDYAKGVEQFRQAARYGSTEGMYMLGMAYYLGRGIEQDYTEAAEWLELAAKRGHSRARHQLGVAYLNAQGVTQDEAWGAQWVGQAAASGLAEAQFDLGVLWAQGIGLPQDQVQGAAWLERARRGGSRRVGEVLGALRQDLSRSEWRRAQQVARAALEPAERSRIRFVQLRLHELGYQPGPVDGVWGEQTKAALREFQSIKKLSVTGQIDDASLELLRNRSMLEQMGWL